LLEAICRTRLSPNEHRVVLAMIRELYGWNRKEGPVSAGRIAKLTGIRRHHVWRTLHELERKNIISRRGIAKALGYRNTKGKRKFDLRSTVWALQKDYMNWQGYEVSPSGGTKVSPSSGTNMGPSSGTNIASHKEREIKIKKRGGSVPSQKKKRSQGKMKDFRLKHSALKIYRMLAHLWPEHAVRDDMIQCYERVGKARWECTIKGWIARGYNKRNLLGIIDVADHGFRDEKGGKHGEDRELRYQDALGEA